jgi:glycosyltransferase involved in cell wall biosynthesis
MTKILFISRAYPPIVGGIENQNYELSCWLPKIAEVKTIANTGGKKFLPLFLPYACLKAFFLFRKYDVILLGDAVLSIIGWKLKFFYKKPVICVTHGLDLTYKMKLYQKIWIGIFIKKMDRLIAVGNETIEAGVRRGIAREKFIFIPNGVDTEKFCEPHTREELEKILGEKLNNRKIILSTGRLAVHKGIDWFSENVVPRLSDNSLFVIAGDGEKRKDVEKIIEQKRIRNKIKMLGRVSDKDLKILYNTADIYVKPNIKVEGTMEGFGLVAIEAASCKLPAIASNLEGLKDAIKEGENGFLVESGNVDAWIEKINELLANDELRKSFGEKARRYVIENYGWEKISRKYLEEIKKTIHK